MQRLIYTLLAAFLIAGTSSTAFAQASKNTNVSITEKDGLKKITIKKTLEDGTIDVINWEGTGEIPDDIKKELDKSGKFSIHTMDGDFKFYSTDSVKIDGPHKIMIINNKEGKEGLEKEIEVILEEAREGAVKAVENVKVIRIDKDGEIELDNDHDLDIQIHRIDGDSNEKQVEVIVEENGSGSNVNKVVIIKRVELVNETKEEGTPETTNQINDEAIEKAPQVLERSLNLQDFQVSPNPASERVNLAFKGASVPTTIRVLGLDGKQIYREFIRDFGGTYQNDLDLRGIQSNFVIVNIEQEGKIYSEKLALKK